MKIARRVFCMFLLLTTASGTATPSVQQDVKEKSFAALNGVKINVRMDGPYTADVPLQVVCYFKYTPDGVKRMTGAPVELDKKLGGVIASLRERGEFVGDEMETLLITPPSNSIKAKALLLVGLGAEENLSPKVLEGVGRASLRAALKLGTTRVAFAPLIRDQGNTKLSASDVEVAVVTSMLLAYDTERRLQKEDFAKPFALAEWNVEAGPAYFDETVAAVQSAIKDATAVAAKRTSLPYRRPQQ